MILSPVFVPTAAPQLANTYNTSLPPADRATSDVQVATLSGGGSVIVWVSEGQDGDGAGVFARMLGQDGIATGPEISVNSFTAFDQSQPAVTALSDGGFMVVWASDRQDGSDKGIFAQRFDASGAKVGAEVQISDTLGQDQTLPDIVTLRDGSVFVAWTETSTNGGTDIRGRGYGADGTALGASFRVNQTASADQTSVSLDAVGDGVAASWRYGVGYSPEAYATHYFTDLTDTTGPEVLLRPYASWSRQYTAETSTVALGDNSYALVYSLSVYGNFYASGETLAAVFSTDGVQIGDLAYAGLGVGHSAVALADNTLLILQDLTAIEGPQGLYANVLYDPTLGPDGIVQTAFSHPTQSGAQATNNAMVRLTDDTVLVAWAAGSDIIYNVMRLNHRAAGDVQVTGDAFAGNSLTALPVDVTDADGIGAFSYQWYRNGTEILDAVTSEYMLTDEDIGNRVHVDVSFGDGNGATEIIRSIATEAIGRSVTGTDGADTLSGTAGNDLISALAGDDSVNGLGGFDTIDGGAGNDQITGTGDLRGGAGNDTISLLRGSADGGDGDDLLTASAQDDLLLGGSGADTVYAGAGADTLEGGDGNDVLYGEDGADVLRPGLGTDSMTGGNGIDMVIGTAAELSDDLVMDMTGSDIILLTGAALTGPETWTVSGGNTVLTAEVNGAAFSLRFTGDMVARAVGLVSLGADLGIGVLRFDGSTGNDVLTGNMLPNFLGGAGGNDLLSGEDGNDTLDGGTGNDTLGGGAGDDRLTGGSGLDKLYGGVGDDQMFGDADDDTLTGGDGDDLLFGGAGADSLSGDAGNDTIDGGDGQDLILGGDGDDVLRGGTSDADLGDVIYGREGNDSIDGGYGNDILRGDEGNDTIAGGFGADTVIGGTGDDVLTGSALGDLMIGGDGNDFINGGFGFDRVNGGAGADRFFHLGVRDHGSDWIQDYNAADGDVLLFGGPNTTLASDFLIQRATTATAGDAGVQEIFVTQISTGNLLWALVDGAGQAEINIQIGSEVFDLLA